MPDFSYIDQVFDKATPGAAVSEEDARAVEDLYRPDNEEEEKQQQQQVSQPETNRVAGKEGVQQRGGMDMIQGAMKWVEENVGIPLEDTIDNVFQGNQRTPEQVSQDRAGRRESLGQQLEQQKTVQDLPNPVRGAVEGLGEVGGVIAGGMTGAAETVLNTAEIAGDTLKVAPDYFATLGNVSNKDNPFNKEYTRVPAGQNPFSNKYEWASWDLGKAEAGAQTGAGKVAQGFLEFGILMAGTGGFNSLPAAGAKFAAAGTALGKAGVVAKAGLVGARSGIAADMMSATRGEGNLSNLIKENAPEWYPTWATALAIDEDDSPWEAMLKTGLEGMGIGGSADAVGGYLSGVRAARRVLKAGGTADEAAAAAVQEAQEVIELTTPASSGSFSVTKPATPEEYVQALEATKASDPAQYWSVDGVDLDAASKGKIISVEGGAGVVGPDGDIKGIFKDPNSGRKGVADEVLQEAVRQGGIKLDNFDVGAENGNPGYLTKIYERNGFRQVGRTPFNAEFAPPGWDEALHDRPEVVAMVYDPRRLLDMTDEGRMFADYDELIAYRDGILADNPQLRTAKDQLTRGNLARLTTPLPNGNRVRWKLRNNPDVVTAYNLPPETKALEVTWSMGVSDDVIGTHGTRVYRDFQRIAREELEPGTIVYNYPAVDSYSRGGASPAQARSADSRGIRERIYTRAGFGPVNAEGVQAAVVRNSPDGGGRWLEPVVDFNNPDAVLASINSQRHYLQRADDMLRALPRQDAVNEAAAHVNQTAYVDLARLRAGEGLTPAQIADQFAIEHSGRDPWGSMDNTRYQTTRIREAQQAGYGADTRRAALENLIAQAQRGIPVTWDDAAAVVPDMFTPGARQIDELSPGVIRSLQSPIPGAPSSINLLTGEATPGFAVDIDFKRLEGDITPESIEDFIGDNMQILSREDAAIRSSIGEDGVKAIELVRTVEDPQEARFLANLFDRPSLDDNGAGRAIPLGGGDSLRGTQGQHLASRFGTPMESRTVTPGEAVAQQIAARGTPGVQGGAQRMVTDAQLRIIARSVGDAPTQVLRNMVRNNPINLEELSHLSKMSIDEVTAEAAKGMQEALGVTGEIDFDKILRMNVDGEELLSRAGIVQVRGLMQEVTTRLYDSAYNVMKLGEVDTDVFPQVGRMADDLKALMRIHKVSANTYSHLLSDYKIKVPGLGIEIENPFKPPSVEEIAKEINNADKVLDEVVKGLTSGEPAAKQQAWRLASALMLAGGDPSKMPALWKSIREIITGEALSVMYNSLVSGPKTHAVNALSNIVNTAYRPLSAFAGGNGVVKKAAIAGYYNIHKTLLESLVMAGRTLKDGPIDDSGKGFVMGSEITAKLQILHRAAEVSTDVGFKAGVGFADMLHGVAEFPLFSWPTRLLATGDDFFKTMISRMEFNSRSMMEAIGSSAGTDQPVNTVFKELIAKNRDQAFDAKSGAILDRDLKAAAKDVTFQADLEGQIKVFADAVNQLPVLRVFFPFVRIGHNINIYAASHVPYLGTFLKEYKAAMEGSDAYTKAVFKGRQAFGTMLIASAAIAVDQGKITGNGPSDPDEKKLWLAKNPARSFDLGNGKWVDYSRIEPFGQIVSAVADLHFMFTTGKLSEDRAKYMAGYLSYAIAANLTNKSFMQGVTPLSTILTPTMSGGERVLTAVAGIANNFVPLSGQRRAFANAFTPYSQEFNGLMDRFLYQASGGLAKTGSPMYDWLDATLVPNPQGAGNALNPLAIQTRGKDVVKDALEDIEFDSSIITKTITGVKLDHQHRSRMQQLMGQSGLHSELKAWVTHPSFKPAVAEFQQQLRSGERVTKENTIFYNRITRTIERYRDVALNQVKREFPELQSQIIEEKLIKAEQRRPTQETKPIDFEYLVNMPH